MTRCIEDIQDILEEWKELTAKGVNRKISERAIYLAVKRWFPHTKLGREQVKKLRVL